MGAVRTLVVSDLHLGTRRRHDVLAYREPLERLLDTLPDVDRLVLLGDVLELLERHPQRGLVVAEPVLRAIGATLGRDREVIVVPGNHDRALVRPWIARMGETLEVDSRVPLDATALLARVAEWLRPARVRVHYPGVWLAPAVWATHGHYLDQHLLPEAAFGVTRGLLGRRPNAEVRPSDYELSQGSGLSRAEALARRLPAPLAALAEDVAELARAATMPRASLLRRSLAPLHASLLGLQMRRASIPALLHVVRRLGVEADWVLFGHVHRLGPLPGDLDAQWASALGGPRVVNTGSWMYEPLLVHRARAPHPYWPGGAIWLRDDLDSGPRPVGLLDEVPAAAMH